MAWTAPEGHHTVRDSHARIALGLTQQSAASDGGCRLTLARAEPADLARSPIGKETQT